MDARFFTLISLVGFCAGMKMTQSTTNGPKTPSQATAPAANKFDTVSQVQANQPYQAQQPPHGGSGLPYPPQQPAQQANGPSYPSQQTAFQPYPPQQHAQIGVVKPYQPTQGGGTPYIFQQPGQIMGVSPYLSQYPPQQPAPNGGFLPYGSQPQMTQGIYGLTQPHNQGLGTGQVAFQHQMYQQQPYLQQLYNQGQQTPTSYMRSAQHGHYPAPTPKPATTIKPTQPTKPSFDVAKAKAYATKVMTADVLGVTDMMEQMNTMKGYGQNLAKTSFYVRHDVNQFPSYGWMTSLPKNSPAYAKATSYLQLMYQADLRGDQVFRTVGLQMTLNKDKNVAFMANLDAFGGLFGDSYRMVGKQYISNLLQNGAMS